MLIQPPTTLGGTDLIPGQEKKTPCAYIYIYNNKSVYMLIQPPNLSFLPSPPFPFGNHQFVFISL